MEKKNESNWRHDMEKERDGEAECWRERVRSDGYEREMETEREIQRWRLRIMDMKKERHL